MYTDQIPKEKSKEIQDFLENAKKQDELYREARIFYESCAAKRRYEG